MLRIMLLLGMGRVFKPCGEIPRRLFAVVICKTLFLGWGQFLERHQCPQKIVMRMIKLL